MLFLQNVYGEGRGSLALRTLVSAHVDELRQDSSKILCLEDPDEVRLRKEKEQSLRIKIGVLQSQLRELELGLKTDG